jgi:hypothetical protein
MCTQSEDVQHPVDSVKEVVERGRIERQEPQRDQQPEKEVAEPLDVLNKPQDRRWKRATSLPSVGKPPIQNDSQARIRKGNAKDQFQVQTSHTVPAKTHF